MLDPNTHPLTEGGDDGPPPPPFGSTESAGVPAISHRLPKLVGEADASALIDDAFAACRAVGGGEGAFGDSWKARKIELLLPAYQLFILVRDNPGQLARVARDGGIFMTKAKEKNDALVCIQIGARPKDTDQDKLCSDWSTILSCALAKQISVDGFIAWVGGTTVRACKVAVAEQKRAAKILAGIPARKRTKASSSETASGRSDAGGAPRLELHLHGADSPAVEVVELPAAALAALFEVLTAPDHRDEFLRRMPSALQDLAAELATNKEHASASLPSSSELEESPTTADIVDA